MCYKDIMNKKEDNNKSPISDYIEKNYKILTVLGIFAAFSLFSQSLLIPALGIFLSFIFLTLFCILFLELLHEDIDNTTGIFYWFNVLISLALFLLIINWFLQSRLLVSQESFYMFLNTGISFILTGMIVKVMRERDWIHEKLKKMVKNEFVAIIIIFTIYYPILLGINISSEEFLEHRLERAFASIFEEMGVSFKDDTEKK